MFLSRLAHKLSVPSAEESLPGRDTEIPVPATHFVNGASLKPPWPDGTDTAVFGMGCFWGAERGFWETPGVVSTAVGYAGGHTPNPTYEEVCSGRTGHTEVVLVAYDPNRVSYDELLRVFWEGRDPTQGMRQGNDVGTQYRSAVYWVDEEQRRVAEQAKALFSRTLSELGYGSVTTEIAPLREFYYAEDYHQQYLAKNPFGYRCHATTGVKFPLAELTAASPTALAAGPDA